MASRAARGTNGRGGGAGASAGHIGATTRIRGRVGGEGDLVVEGHVEGNVALRGDLTVEGGGAVSGDSIEAESITVGGVLEGDMRVTGQVHALAGSRVRGDVHGGSLALDEGAEFAGRVENDFELPPELERPERRR